jgi:HEAT repeat protein
MPREQLNALATEVERLLNSGAFSAGHEGLRRQARILQRLGRGVPALQQIAEQVERLCDASPTEAAPRFLDLLVTMRAVRGSLAGAQLPRKVEPLSPSGPWATATPSEVLYPLVRLLVMGEPGRGELLKGVTQGGKAGDLRLLEALFAAAEHASGALAVAVLFRILPAFGGVVVPELRRSFRPAGGRRDVLRLLALCRLDTQVGIEVCQEALAGGQSELRRQALRCLTRLDPAAAERTALGLLKEPQGEAFRVAILGALQRSRKSVALDACLAAASDTPAVWAAAVVALRQLPQPRTVERLLEEVQTAARQAEAAEGPRHPLDPGPADWQRAVQRTRRLVRALQQRGDERAVPVLVGLLKHRDGPIQEAAGDALVALGDPEGLRATAKLVRAQAAWRPGVRAVWRLGSPAQRYEQLAALCDTLSSSRKGERDRGEFLLGVIEEEARRNGAALQWDRRWGETLARHAQGPSWALVLRALARIGPAAAEAVAVLVRLLRHVRPDLREAAAEALFRIGRPALPALTAALASEDDFLRRGALLGLGLFRTDTAAILPALLPLLHDPIAEVRMACAQTLGTLGAPAGAAVPALAETLRDGRAAVRQTAAWALGRMGPAAGAAAEALREAQRSETHGPTRDTLNEVLAQIEPNPSPPTPLPQGARGGERATPLPSGARGEETQTPLPRGENP